jgi:hypothetical protein
MRALLLSLCFFIAAPVLAQSPASPEDSGRQFDAGRGAELQNWEWRARQGALPTEAERAVDAVLNAVRQRDCKAAVAALNAGLAKSVPEVWTLAGALFEEGVCVKPNWERAVNFYQRAIGVGHPGVAARLASGYAAPVGGPDKAAALWWAYRAKTALPAECKGAAALVDDAERFVAALQAWPAGQLDACVYAAGVMARIQGDLESPGLASSFGLEGKVTLVFVPAQGKVDITETMAEAAPPGGVVADGVLREREQRLSRQAFTKHLRDTVDRALRRYLPPAAVPAVWQVQTDIPVKLGR